MKKLLLLGVALVTFYNCGSTKHYAFVDGSVSKEEPSKKVVKEEPKKVTKKPIEVKKPKGEMPKKSYASPTDEYIANYSAIAITEMKKYKIPASITLAQGILESGSGNGRLSAKANNHFGIKCHNWNGDKIYHDDDALQECFRKYTHAEESFNDHSLFLTSRSRYANLFKLKSGDYKGWAHGLKKAGYATDPKYPNKLIDLIERYKLYQYDDFVLKGKKVLEVTPENIVVEKNMNVHVVKKGDTLYSLSRLYDVPVSIIKELNNLNTNALSIGQQIKLSK